MEFKEMDQVTKYIDLYCFKLFRKIDEELVPQLHLVEASNEYLESIMKDAQFDVFLSEPFTYHHKKYFYALQFDAKVIETYYKVPQDVELEVHSLLNAIINELLSYISICVNSLLLSEVFYEKNLSEIIKRAGHALLQAILGNPLATNPFEKCNKISSLSYEKSFSEGKILLLNAQAAYALASEHVLKPLVQFEQKIPLSSTRHIRKILELSNSDIYLLSDGAYLYSTVAFIENHNATYHFFTIEFNNYFSWQLNHNGNKLMQVIHEEVYIPKPKISYSAFNLELKKVFPGLESKRALNLYRLILEALTQTKGTILVISKNARSEAYRLRNQGFLIEALSLTPSTIRSITSIDGAVLMDLDGYCHGIGVILDGVATEKGDPSRGARYNSAIRYVETISKTPNYSNCFSVVISEDGDVDMISEFLYN